MNKFTQIIQNTLNQLNEGNADGTTAAGPYNGGVPTTSVDKPNNTNKSTGVSDPNNPLHTAFNKIQTNPSTPNLSPDEHKALQDLAKNLGDANDSTNDESEEEQKQSNVSGGQVQNTIVSGDETYKSSNPGITG